MKNIDKSYIIEDIWYKTEGLDNTNMVVMIDTGTKDFSIAEIKIKGDEDEDKLYDLAYEVAHDLGYVLSGEVEQWRDKCDRYKQM